MKRATLYAIIPGLFIIVWKLVVFFTHNQLNPAGIYSSLVGIVLLFVSILFSIRHKRSLLGGFISLKQSMKAGMYVGLFTSVMVALFTYLYFQFIDIGYVDLMKDKATEVMIEQKKTLNEIDMAKTNISIMFSPFRQATYTLGYILIASTVFSFICSSFLVKEDPSV